MRLYLLAVDVHNALAAGEFGAGGHVSRAAQLHVMQAHLTNPTQKVWLMARMRIGPLHEQLCYTLSALDHSCASADCATRGVGGHEDIHLLTNGSPRDHRLSGRDLARRSQHLTRWPGGRTAGYALGGAHMLHTTNKIIRPHAFTWKHAARASKSNAFSSPSLVWFWLHAIFTAQSLTVVRVTN